ncbi:MAG: replication factor C small subunit [Promethearchaeota archaeon]
MVDEVIEVPWVEKYRPRHLRDVIAHEETVNALKHFVEKKNVPHLLFSGPAGTGKTSTALALIRDFLGEQFSRTNVLELNASESVRMATARDVIKHFVKRGVMLNAGLKFVVLDEADNVPRTVQQALRRMMEQRARDFRFILLCNYPYRLIDPIISRCAVFRFPPLNKEQVLRKLREVAKGENLSLSDDLLELVQFVSRGDLRRAINLLQIATSVGESHSLTHDGLLELAGFATRSEIEGLFETLRKGDVSACFRLAKQIFSKVPPRNFLVQLLDEVNSLDLLAPQKAEVLRTLGRFDFRYTQQTASDVQSDALVASLALAMGGAKE